MPINANRTKRTRSLVVALLVITIIVALFAWAFYDRSRFNSIATPQLVMDNQSMYIGNVTNVAGEVNSIIDSHSFTIGGSQFQNNPELLIIHSQSMSVKKGDVVIAKGPVLSFDLSAVQKETGLHLKNDLYTEFTGQPAVIARSLLVESRISETPLVKLPSPLGDVTILLQSQDPGLLVGQQVQTTDIIVQKVVSDKVVFVGPDGQHELLTILPPGLKDQGVLINNGTHIMLTATVQDLPSLDQIEKIWHLSQSYLSQVRQEGIYLNATQVSNIVPSF